MVCDSTMSLEQIKKYPFILVLYFYCVNNLILTFRNISQWLFVWQLAAESLSGTPNPIHSLCYPCSPERIVAIVYGYFLSKSIWPAKAKVRTTTKENPILFLNDFVCWIATVLRDIGSTCDSCR